MLAKYQTHPDIPAQLFSMGKYQKQKQNTRSPHPTDAPSTPARGCHLNAREE
jgi:hypothetical protein